MLAQEKTWVYGVPLTNPRGQTFICSDMLSGWDVDPETVCEFTGLTDKNGKKIFEGDIVQAGSEGFITNCEVKCRIDGIYYMNPDVKTVWYMMPNSKGETTVKIIGNIHDISGIE